VLVVMSAHFLVSLRECRVVWVFRVRSLDFEAGIAETHGFTVEGYVAVRLVVADGTIRR